MNKDIKMMILEKAARKFFMSHKEPEDLLSFLKLGNYAVRDKGALEWSEVEEVLLKACFS